MLSNVLKRSAVPPNSHSNELSVFYIDPNIVILPNLRLAGVGATVVGGADVTLPRSSGIVEIIENVYVELDTEKIADNKNLALYASLFNQMIENKRQKNVSTVLRRTELGTRSLYEEPTNTWSSDGKIKAGVYSARRGLVRTNQLTDNANTTAQGLIHLSDFIEFFNSPEVKYLPYLPNLKISVEYKNLLADDVLSYVVKPLSYQILRPKLIYDEIIDAASLRQIPRGFSTTYLEPVFEYQQLPAVNPGSTLRTSIISQAFDGKYLEDLAISLEAVNDRRRNLVSLGFNSSVAQKDEVIMVVLNGSNHLPEQGLDSSAKKQLYQAISRGPMCIPYSGYQYAATTPDQYLQGRKIGDLKGNLSEAVGRQSFTTVGVGAPVGTLVLQYTRQGQVEDVQSGPLLLTLFGRVLRSLQVTPEGRANLAYVPGLSSGTVS